MDRSTGVFFAFIGTIVAWIGFWEFMANIVRASNRNPPPGSRAKKVLDAINIMQVLPLLPLVPILVIWRLGVNRPIARYKARRQGKKEVIKMRRCWEGTRSQWAANDLESARSEKAPLFQNEEIQADGARPELPPFQPPKATSKGEKSRFESLPAELRMEVYSYLDLGMAVRLHRINHFIRSDNPEESIDREQRATYIYHADTFQHNRKAGRFACFSCLKLKDKGEFGEDRRTGEYKRYGIKDVERRCFDCQVVKGEKSWKDILRWRMGRWEAMMWGHLTGIFSRVSGVS